MIRWIKKTKWFKNAVNEIVHEYVAAEKALVQEARYCETCGVAYKPVLRSLYPSGWIIHTWAKDLNFYPTQGKVYYGCGGKTLEKHCYWCVEDVYKQQVAKFWAEDNPDKLQECYEYHTGEDE